MALIDYYNPNRRLSKSTKARIIVQTFAGMLTGQITPSSKHDGSFGFKRPMSYPQFFLLCLLFLGVLQIVIGSFFN